LEAVKDKIRELLDQKFGEKDYEDCFLVDLTLSKSNKLQVFVDCDSGLNLEKCSLFSRYLESWLDESLALGEKYTLEVSSPGVDRPLVKRQFPKNKGRQIRVKTTEGKLFNGVLDSVSESYISVRIEKKKEDPSLEDIRFDDIEEAKIIVSF
jgi:ribosome maturation factor RimP